MSIDAVAERLGVSTQELVDAIVELADGKLSVLDHVHGTWPAYKSGCRCELCRDLPSRSVKDDTPHGTSRWRFGCRCKVCTEEHSAIRNTSNHKIQRRTEETASRRGYEWTGPELEIAARPDLTAQQVALMLGRTLRGVRRMRDRLRNDPKIRHLAGVTYPSIGALPHNVDGGPS
jgi:hypothetical protein